MASWIMVFRTKSQTWAHFNEIPLQFLSGLCKARRTKMRIDGDRGTFAQFMKTIGYVFINVLVDFHILLSVVSSAFYYKIL